MLSTEKLGLFGGMGVPFLPPPQPKKGGSGVCNRAGTKGEQTANIAGRVHVMSHPIAWQGRLGAGALSCIGIPLYHRPPSAIAGPYIAHAIRHQRTRFSSSHK